jgi:hypothetical protein
VRERERERYRKLGDVIGEMRHILQDIAIIASYNLGFHLLWVLDLPLGAIGPRHAIDFLGQ